jgi:hypothetical protein
MKTRQGFVSNSSSSSFILAVDAKRAEKEISVKVSIEPCIEKRIDSVDELNAYLIEQYAWREDCNTIEKLLDEGDFEIPHYEAMVEALKDEKIILFGSGSSEGDSPGDLAVYYGALDNLVDDDVQVIENCQ